MGGAGLNYRTPERQAVELTSPGGCCPLVAVWRRKRPLLAATSSCRRPVPPRSARLGVGDCHRPGAFSRAGGALAAVAGARNPVWAAACVLEDERRIAEMADVLSRRPGPQVGEEAAITAVRNVELSRGMRLTERQAEVAKGLLMSGQVIDLVIGVAGSGKTRVSAVRKASRRPATTWGPPPPARRPRPWAKERA